VTDLNISDIAPLKLKERKVLRGHFAKIYSLAWAKDSTQLVSASQDGKLIVSFILKSGVTNVSDLGRCQSVQDARHSSTFSLGHVL